jgi:putative tryptophan/tyrosine transport system substrate-binding protein
VSLTRRHFLAAASAGALAGPLVAVAQLDRKIKIGWLLPEPKTFALDPFRRRLGELGWSEGNNLTIEQRYAHGDRGRYISVAADLAKLPVDVLVTDGAAATTAAERATTTIPIVFVSGNPVGQGFVASLSHPGRNLTGVAILTGDLMPKRVQLLKELATGMTRLAIVEDLTAAGLAVAPNDARIGGNWQAIEAAAREVGVQLAPTIEIRTPTELDGAFTRAVQERAGGVLVLASPFFSSRNRQLVAQAAATRLPAIYEHRGFVEAGGLMSYGPDHRAIFRLVAEYVDRILRGAKPGDLPVEQPTGLELLINERTARGLGLAIPPSLLARADGIIQ